MLPIPHALMDEADSKLYVLLALEELGSCTHMQLLHFMFENDIMTSFDLSLALPKLLSDGHISRTSHPADSLYAITEAGSETLSFFINKRLAHSKVALIREQAPAWRARFTKEKQFVAKVTQNTSGEYVAHLQLVEGAASMLSIDMAFPELSMAKRLAASWPERALEIYQGLLSSLEKEQK